MKKLGVIVLFILGIISFSYAQNQSERFFKDRYQAEEVQNLKKAKYKEVISYTTDSVKVVHFYRIKKKKLILLSDERFKNGNQVGVWKYYDKKGTLERSIDFTTNIFHLDKKSSSENYVTFKKSEVISLNEEMEPPKLLNYESIFHAVYGSLMYPAYARINGIQGKVILHCKISKTGEFEILGILKSSHPILEKPAWIAMLDCAEWQPAKINGLPVDSFTHFTVNFKLE